MDEYNGYVTASFKKSSQDVAVEVWIVYKKKNQTSSIVHHRVARQRWSWGYHHSIFALDDFRLVSSINLNGFSKALDS